MSSSESAASLLVDIAGSLGVSYIKGQSGEPYAVVQKAGHKEIWECSSKEFRDWLGYNYYIKHKAVVSATALRDALNTIHGIAMFEAEQATIHNRVAFDGPSLYYDLADECRNVIRISAKDWKVDNSCPVFFKRRDHQLRQVLPAGNGDITLLTKYLNVPSENQRLLLLCTMLSYFIPGIPHNILMLHGPQGSSKTTTAKLLRCLVDPSKSPTMRLASNLNDLSVQLYHHMMPVYDNLSSICSRQSDALCSAVTGDSICKRTLYTTNDQTHFSYQPCIVMTGINIIPWKSDLLDRTILVALNSMSSNRRLEESELYLRFESDRPRILAGICDVLVKSLQIHKNLIRDSGLTRMADSHKWGHAFATAMGYSTGDYETALRENDELKNMEVVACNPVASAVICFMEGRDNWEGTATDLLPLLRSAAEVSGFSTRSGMWPQAPHTLSRRLNESAENLRKEHLIIKLSRSGPSRRISIERISQPEKGKQ